MGGPIDAAVADRRVQVVRFFVEGRQQRASLRDGRDVLPKSNQVVLVVHCATQPRRTERRCRVASENHEFSNDSILIALDEGARNDHCEWPNYSWANLQMMKLMSSRGHSAGIQSIVNLAYCSAARPGSVEMAKILMGKCHSEMIGHAVREAASEGNHELVKLLLMECEARHLEESWYYSHVGMAVQNAALRSDLEMAKLLIAKCDPPSAGRVLQMAVANDTGYAAVISPMTGVYYKEDPYKVNALVRTAKKVKLRWSRFCPIHSITTAFLQWRSGRNKLLLRKLDPASYKHTFAIAAEKNVVQLVEILLEHMDTSNIRWALMTATSKGYLGTVKSMLQKCEAASIGCALEVAVLKNELAVIDVLRKRCDPTSISDAIASAKANGYTVAVQLLDCKRSRLA
ncbi:Ankyrin repeat-containing domain [Phytophthora cactorum]|nr:Ankyrin repeat-containing domain [Phytophthora cactorum]